MKTVRKSLIAKLLVSFLTIVMTFGAGFGVVSSAMLWNYYYEENYMDSGLYHNQLDTWQSRANELYHLQDRTDLSYADQERKKELEELLNHTNFVFTIYVNDEAVLTNRGKTDWNDAQSIGQLHPDAPVYENYEYGWDDVSYVKNTPSTIAPQVLEPTEATDQADRAYIDYDYLVAKDSNGELFLVDDWSMIESLAANGLLFGVRSEDTGVMYSIDYSKAIGIMETLQLQELLGESDPQTEEYETITDYYRMEYGTLAEFPVKTDEFYLQSVEYNEIRTNAPLIYGATAVVVLLLIAAVIWLLVSAGWHKGENTVFLRGTEKLPADGLLVLWGGVAFGAVVLAAEIFHSVPDLRAGRMPEIGLFIGGCAALGVALTIPVIDAIVAQLKCRALLRRLLILAPFRWVGRKIRRCWDSLDKMNENKKAAAEQASAPAEQDTTPEGETPAEPGWFAKDGVLAQWSKEHLRELGRLMKKYVTTALVVGLVFFVYIFVILATGRMTLGWAVFWMLFNICALIATEYWLLKFQDVREGARKIAEGQVEHKVNTDKMPPDLKEIGESLNNLSEGVNKAVEERMKSERFRAELITNVSHDLKTPLTSIINYIDLLKKTPVENPEAREYIEVLDRKSQQLKKLTEDLVEASKASTGSMPTNLEVLNLSQLVNQALGEYDERLLDRKLHVVLNQPETVMVKADGRHLWRVLDNLLGNCVKYAMPGTRVYLTTTVGSVTAEVTVKNISEAPLNLTEEELMERFVQGDSSRSAEGSGLGLSIARSLMTLQHGSFAISVDGDLFKATFTVPLAEEE